MLAGSFYSDVGRIKQVLLNLISNALKFTQQGGIVVSIKLKRKFDEGLFERSRHLAFKVRDTGIGIPEEEQSELFKLFGTIRSHRDGVNKRGTGLGLSISKKLTQSMGGDIKIKSEVGVGTTLKFFVKEIKQNSVLQVVEGSAESINEHTNQS